MRRRSPHARGLLVVGAGVVLLSPDGLLVRLVQADAPSLLVWRGALLAAALAGLLLRHGPSRAVASVRAIGRAGGLAAVLFAASNVCFVLAIGMTTVAMTLVILATGPLFAALFSRVLLRERAPARTYVAMAVAIAGILVAVRPAGDGGRIVGDLFALGAAGTFAGQLTALRKVGEIDVTPVVALGGLLTALVALPFAAPLSVVASDVPWLLLIGLVVLPASFGLISTGPRWLPAPEVNLLMLLETVLGPLWVWLALAEEPAGRELAGGAIVILALVAHSFAGLSKSKSDRPGLDSPGTS